MHDLKLAACDYFLFLSSIEYALKNGGYAKADTDYDATPDWNKFKDSVHDSMVIDDNDPDIKAIRDQRPARQIYKNEKLDWSSPQKIGQTDKKALIDACLTIRNNLFHGGKHGDGNAGRNKTLIRAALKILNAALDAEPTVKNQLQNAIL